jgi:hypothetical protein
MILTDLAGGAVTLSLLPRDCLALAAACRLAANTADAAPDDQARALLYHALASGLEAAAVAAAAQQATDDPAATLAGQRAAAVRLGLTDAAGGVAR